MKRSESEAFSTSFKCAITVFIALVSVPYPSIIFVRIVPGVIKPKPYCAIICGIRLVAAVEIVSRALFSPD